GAGAAASPPAAKPTPPPAAVLQPTPLLQRMAGMAPFAATQPTTSQAEPIKLDPFFEVRTPARNYGPARLAGGRSVTPLARRLAAEGGIDLATLSPSGPHDRIVARDVEAAARAAPQAAPRPTVAAAAGRTRGQGP